MAIKRKEDLEPNYGMGGTTVERTVTPQYKTTQTYPTGTDFGEYKNQWQDQLDDYMSRIMTRPAFSYDLNGDALYKQYRDQFMRQGKLAMADTVGQVSALTGGYGNSYAASAAQQQYNAYLGQLNDKVPELYSLARGAYDADTQALIQQYGILQDREKQDYDRYMDAYSIWKANQAGRGGGGSNNSDSGDITKDEILDLANMLRKTKGGSAADEYLLEAVKAGYITKNDWKKTMAGYDMTSRNTNKRSQGGR